MEAGNRGWSFSATQWIFGSESVETTARRLAGLGYSGIEPAGEPEAQTADGLRAAVEPFGLRVTSICGTYPPGRDLSHPSSEARESAVAYVIGCLRLAATLGASPIIVVPTAVGRVQPEASRAQEWRWAVESIRRAAEVAEETGVQIVIEALNRYETYLVTTLDAAAQMAAEVDSPNVGLMADLFHMNIEEASLPDAIRAAGPLLRHVHLADSNRRAPGLGHTGFRTAVEAVRETGYRGPLTMEFLPPTANPYLAASLDVPEADKLAGARQAIDYMREVTSG